MERKFNFVFWGLLVCQVICCGCIIKRAMQESKAQGPKSNGEERRFLTLEEERGMGMLPEVLMPRARQEPRATDDPEGYPGSPYQITK